jgi:thioredoxin 1
MKEKASKLRDEGMEWNEIADEVNKKKETVYGWVKYDKQPLPSNDQLYDEWIQERRCDLNERFIWEKVREIDSLDGSHKTVSMEIDGTHNYFANGILTHNCGPCKKLAPRFEEVSEEIDEVNFGKVDMEENQQLGTQNGVRALPTLLIMRDGEEIARTSGAMPKQKLKNWIEENTA